MTCKGKLHNASGIVSPICKGLISVCPSAASPFSGDCAWAVDRLNNMKHKNPKQRILMFFNAIKENKLIEKHKVIEKHNGRAKLNNVRLRLYLDLNRRL